MLLILAGMQHTASAQLQKEPTTIAPVIINGSNIRSCPSQQQREGARQQIKHAVANALGLGSTFQCGGGQWTRVAYLNMSDPTQSCPTAWRYRLTNGVRACGRPSSGCYSALYPNGGRAYTKVCGRVIGYQDGHPDAFNSNTIDGAYVEGVSITHGSSPRSHIWTFAGDRYESFVDCPCEGGSSAPAFVGNNYYCESGNNGTSAPGGVFYANDPLWDGQQCQSEGTCCSTAPWFTADLVNSTTDSIEVRICSTLSPSSEDTRINLLELYIQ